MVDDFTLRANRQRSRAQPAGVPMMYPLPLRNHPMWTGNNELGREAEFAPDSNNQQTVLKLEEWGAPEVWSVHLGMKFDEAQIAAANGFSVIAKVQAGVGGAVQEFEVDWTYGTTFSCVMNALTVAAEYDDISDIPTDLRLIATVCKGKVCNLPPTRTKYFAVAAGPGATTFSIPKFARSVYFGNANNAGTSVYSANCEIQVQSALGGGTGIRIVGTDLQPLGGSVPIPNGARFVNVINAAAGPAPDMLGVAIFSLAF